MFLCDILSLEVVLYLYEGTISPCMEYCCYILVCVSNNCYLESSDKLLMWVWCVVGPTLATSLETFLDSQTWISLAVSFVMLKPFFNIVNERSKGFHADIFTLTGSSNINSGIHVYEILHCNTRFKLLQV